MGKGFPRRSLFQIAGAAALLRSRASAQQPAPGQAPTRRGGGWSNTGNPEPFPALDRKATVALTQGDDRRKNVYNAPPWRSTRTFSRS